MHIIIIILCIQYIYINNNTTQHIYKERCLQYYVRIIYLCKIKKRTRSFMYI